MKKPTSNQYLKEILQCPDCKFLDEGKTFIQCLKHSDMQREIIRNIWSFEGAKKIMNKEEKVNEL